MKPEEKLILLAELATEKAYCCLNHGRFDTPGLAVNFIVQPFGYAKNAIELIATDELILPICADCVEALTDNEWYLLYCTNCGQSQWIIQELARRTYPDIVNWLKKCPHCWQKELEDLEKKNAKLN